jgi:hypothetical protein
MLASYVPAHRVRVHQRRAETPADRGHRWTRAPPMRDPSRASDFVFFGGPWTDLSVGQTWPSVGSSIGRLRRALNWLRRKRLFASINFGSMLPVHGGAGPTTGLRKRIGQSVDNSGIGNCQLAAPWRAFGSNLACDILNCPRMEVLGQSERCYAKPPDVPLFDRGVGLDWPSSERPLAGRRTCRRPLEAALRFFKR